MKKLFLLVAFSCQLLLAQQVKFFNTYSHGIFDSGEGVWTSKDTGYVVGGITTQTGSNGTDALIYKVDSLGNLQWYKNIGLDNSIEGAKSITCGKNGTEFVLAGYQNNYDSSGYNFYAVKTDFNGDTIWTRIYGGSDWDMAYSVDTLQDSTYVIAGETFSFGAGNSDMYVIRIDNNGDTLWTRTFGGAQDDYARYVYVDRHDNIIVIGTTYSFGAGGSDVYIVHLDPMGDTIWTKTYGTSVDEFGLCGDMFLNYAQFMTYAFGYTQYDPTSSLQEARFFKGDSASCALVYDWGWFFNQPARLCNMKMRKFSSGRFNVAGNFQVSNSAPTEIFQLLTDYGILYNVATQAIYFHQGEQSTNDIRRCFDGGNVLTGSTTYYGPGPTSTFILKTDTDFVAPASILVGVEDIPIINFGVYPNPVRDQMVFVDAGTAIEEIRLFDLSGRMVQYIKGQNFPTQTLYLDKLPYGMYVLEVKTTAGVGREKLLIAGY